MRKLLLFISSIIQYFRIRSRDKSKLEQNDLAQICRKKPYLYANNDTELMFILKYLRPIALRVSKENICLDLSLVLLNMSSIPTEIHFSIRKNASNYKGHAWVETKNSLFSTDYTYDQESIWHWEKPLDAL